MLSCQDFSDALYPFFAHELPADRRAELERHLADCERCRADLAWYELIVQLLGQLPAVSLPHHLRKRFRAECRLQGRGSFGVGGE
jgi:anti-sigma factor RsiW